MKKIEKGVTLQIQGKDYQIACEPGERDNLQRAADYLGDKLAEINSRGKVIGTERSAVLAALNISYELMQVQDQKSKQVAYEKRIKALQNKVEDSIDQFRQIAL